jgi:hypothetical protein
MQDIDFKLCRLISELTDCTIESLKEMKNGFLLNNILNKIDSEYFPLHKVIFSWEIAESNLQKFLMMNGLEEILDFDLGEIARGKIECIISAVFQICAILAVFNPSGWDRALENVEHDTKFSIMNILGKMIQKIELEMNMTINCSKINSNLEIKELFQKLEFQDNLLKQNEQELLSKTNEIFEKNKEIKKLKEDLRNKKMEFKNYKKTKEEAFEQLSNSYFKENNEGYCAELKKKLEEVNIELENNKKENLGLRDTIEERDAEIDKIKIMFNFYEQHKQEYEEIGAKLFYYKKSMESLQQENDNHIENLQKFQLIKKNIEHLQQKLKHQKRKYSNLEKRNSELTKKVELYQTKCHISNQKIDFFKNNSDTQIDSLLMDKFLEELDKENEKVNEKINKLESAKKNESKENFDVEKKQSYFKVVENVTTLLDIDMNNKYISNYEDSVQILYELCLEYYKDKVLNEQNFLVQRNDRKRDIFSKFTLQSLFNN